MPIKPVRRIARALLGTTFVAAGVNGLLNQKPRAAAADALAEKGRSGLPDALAARVPDDPSQFVRVNSAAQVVGGLLLASGRAPRPAAVMLAATVVPGTVTEQDFWAENDPDRKAAKRVGFLKDLGLLGGLMIAAADTEGKPSLGWRARRAFRREEPRIAAEGAAIATAAKVRGAHFADVAHEQGAHLAEVANERGAALAEIARERGPRLAEAVRSRGAHLVEVAKERGPEVADAARTKGAHLAEVAKERGPELAEVARERGAHFAEVARERGSEAAEAARARAEKRAS